jgi:low affinity Fe/Cu permease
VINYIPYYGKKEKHVREIFELGNNGYRQFGGIYYSNFRNPGMAGIGPIFKYSDTWQLIINTGTTIVTFLMVFLIQKSQNKDSKAIHLKLNEILASHEGSSNRMVDIEDLTEEELDQLHKFYVKLSDLAEKEDDLTCTHSIDAAEENQKRKSNRQQPTKSRAEEAKNNSHRPFSIRRIIKMLRNFGQG